MKKRIRETGTIEVAQSQIIKNKKDFEKLFDSDKDKEIFFRLDENKFERIEVSYAEDDYYKWKHFMPANFKK
ncbi:MAG: hypothetical protein ABIC91_07725 [Nanoarchaeota archaeon]